MADTATPRDPATPLRGMARYDQLDTTARAVLCNELMPALIQLLDVDDEDFDDDPDQLLDHCLVALVRRNIL